MNIQILDKAKKKRFLKELEIFGIGKIPELLIRTGKEKIRAYSGNLSTEEIREVWRCLPIEGIGLYVAKEILDRKGKREVRLSVDALHHWKEQIKKNVLDISEEQEKEWFLGRNVELSDRQRVFEVGTFVAVRSSAYGDFIGMGKIGDGGKILFNFLPKERRRKRLQ